MRHAFVGDRVVDRGRGDVAAHDERAAEHRHHPGVAPAVAVKERDDREVDGEERHPPADRVRRGGEVGAAVVVDHALGPARGAGGVVDRDGFPFVLRPDPGRMGIARGQEILVEGVAPRGLVAGFVVRHLDDGGAGAFGQRERGLGEGEERGIDEDDLRARVAEDVAHRVGVEPGVDGVEDRPRGGDAEMRLGLGGDVGQECRHNVAGRDAEAREAGGEARDAAGEVGVGAPGALPDEGGAGGKHFGRAGEVRKRCQRRVVGRAFLQARLVGKPAHRPLSLPFVARPLAARRCRIRARLWRRGLLVGRREGAP